MVSCVVSSTMLLESAALILLSPTYSESDTSIADYGILM